MLGGSEDADGDADGAKPTPVSPIRAHDGILNLSTWLLYTTLQAVSSIVCVDWMW